MKILVLGGAGVFGQRLAELLIRDGHDVVVAGRTKSALETVARRLDCASLVVDRSGDLSPIWNAKPMVVIDAAGPFHAYGTDPYSLPRAAILHGVHYLDLADDAAFCSQISQLDDAAKQAGVICISGMSSVPALSSAIVAGLANGDPILAIETGILPGNRAPRGQAVVDSILHQAGTDITVTIDGQQQAVRSWSRSRMFGLGQGIRRRGYMIRVPDHLLFPKAFNTGTALFWAGLEVGLMNHGLAVFAWVRDKMGFGVPRWLTRLVRLLAAWLAWMGTDTGGMVVCITVKTSEAIEKREWRLVARQGEGPYIPAIPARTVLRDLDAVAPGAKPAIAVFSMADVTSAMEDLAVTTDVVTNPVTSVFERALGADMDQLPAAVRRTHHTVAPLYLQGEAHVERGGSAWARLLGWIFRFPAASDQTAVQVIKMPWKDQEVWERRFGGAAYQSRLSYRRGRVVETFGPFTFELGLGVVDQTLQFPVTRGWFLGVPLPAIMLPKSETREYEKDGLFHFDVSLLAPLTRALVVRYRGWLEPAS